MRGAGACERFVHPCVEQWTTAIVAFVTGVYARSRGNTAGEGHANGARDRIDVRVLAFLIRKLCLQVGRFCFGVLAFLAETLYLARRFCGLCDSGVNTEFTDL
jgi:hypothetical protein